MRRSIIHASIVLVAFLLASACGDRRRGVGRDTGPILIDSGGDGSFPDSTTPDSDAPDATRDSGTPDTSPPPDSSRPDTGTPDTGVPDTSAPDTSRPDTAPPPGCDVGDMCDPTRGCRISGLCIDEISGEIGGTSDPITGLPGGGTGVPTTSWVGGYCTDTGTLDMGGCDPADDASCGGLSCAVCLNAGTDARGVAVGLCARSCTPSLTSNTCRSGYECGLTSSGCVPGCMIDDECRVVRDDTNRNGFIDPYDPATNRSGDRLVYDSSTAARCNPVTARCEHNGSAAAAAGDTCDIDFDCERNGACIQDRGSDGGWPGGYCTRFGCDVPGASCAGTGVCQERGLGIAICVAPCEVARNVTSSRFSRPRDCRTGYTCFWNGTGGARTMNGGCVPGIYNAVRTPNIGASCVDASTCYSPYGAAQCRDFGGGDHCTLFDCAAPGMPADVCGTSALCVQVSGSDTNFCARSCTNASQCSLPGDGCWDTSTAGVNTGGGRICFPGCMADADCRSGDRCIGATMTAVGTCR